MQKMQGFFRRVQKKLTGPRTGQQEASVDRFTLGNYLEAMRRYKGASLAVLLGFSFTRICFSVLTPLLLAHAVDLISQKQPFQYGSPLFTTLLAALALAIVATISNGMGLRGLARLDARAQNYLRAQAFDRLTSESAAFYSNTRGGALMGNLTVYVQGFAAVQDIVLVRGLNLFLPLVVGLLVIAAQSLLLAGVLVAIALVVGVKTLRDSRRRAPYRKARKEAMSQLNGFLGDVITNNATVRTFAAEAQERGSLLTKQYAWQQAAQKNLLAFARHYVALTGSVHALQILGIGTAALLATNGQIGLGLVVFTIAYFQQLSSGLLELAPLVQSFQGVLMDATPMSEILLSPKTIVDRPRAKRLIVEHGAIRFKNVTHHYEQGSPAVFRNFNLSIPAGQSVGVVGRSGGGKTTLTNLLLRFSDTNGGSILIDDQPVREVTQRSVRKAISYVPQDSQLFHRSIRENIAYGKPQASKRAIVAAAKRAHIWEFIQSLPDGLDTEVGERGLKLSGGQRQRIAIARAILKDAPILIFDEATSALDSESEQHIQASIDELIKNRTSLIIAHRLSTIQKMARIIVLDQGKIVQDGTHRQLLSQPGLYATLWKHQSGGFIEQDSFETIRLRQQQAV